MKDRRCITDGTKVRPDFRAVPPYRTRCCFRCSELASLLRCACRNYRLRFDEQLLIYAQRPDATAVLEIERWNDKFGRWVNRGAKGIAVFEDAERSRQRLTHYFDISDTHASRYSRPVPLWDMKPEYADDVIESLESTFGELENRESLADAVLSAAKNAVEDNIPDYLGDLMYAADDSFLYGLSEDMITAMYKKAVTNSVAYMMMTRLGIDTEPLLKRRISLSLQISIRRKP